MPKPVIFENLLDRIKRAFSLQSSLREKILIIDSNFRQAETIANFLNKQGFSATIVENLSDARRHLKKSSSDLIVTEANPSDGSIIDVAHLGDFDFANTDLVFIALINQDNEADRRMALNAGAKYTVASPLTGESISTLRLQGCLSVSIGKSRSEWFEDCVEG